MNELQGHVAVITGAAGGIGRGIAAMMAREGAAVVIGDIKDAQGEAAAAELRAAGGRVVFQHCDVTSENDCAALMQRAVSEFGSQPLLLDQRVGTLPADQRTPASAPHHS